MFDYSYEFCDDSLLTTDLFIWGLNVCSLALQHMMWCIKCLYKLIYKYNWRSRTTNGYIIWQNAKTALTPTKANAIRNYQNGTVFRSTGRPYQAKESGEETNLFSKWLYLWPFHLHESNAYRSLWQPIHSLHRYNVLKPLLLCAVTVLYSALSLSFTPF